MASHTTVHCTAVAYQGSVKCEERLDARTRPTLEKIVANIAPKNGSASKRTKTSYQYQNHFYHMVVQDETCFVCQTDAEYNTRSVFAYLDEVAEKFKSVIQQGGVTEANCRAFNKSLSQIASQFNINNSNLSTDKIGQVKGQVEQVKKVMIENIDQVLERGQNIDRLCDKSELLSMEADHFSDGARKLKRKMMMRNIMIMAAIVSLVVIVCVVISMFACGINYAKCKSKDTDDNGIVPGSSPPSPSNPTTPSPAAPTPTSDPDIFGHSIYRRVDFPNAVERNLVANDGSPAFFYFLDAPPAAELDGGEEVWMIYLQGGGACFNNASCTSRWIYDQHLMSSNVRGATMNGTGFGFMDGDPGVNNTNPFWRARKIFVPYLSSDTWMGNNSIDLVPPPQADFSGITAPPSTIDFRGRLIVDAVIQRIFEGFSVTGEADFKYQVSTGSSSTRIVLSGDSAGGAGCIGNTNNVKKLVGESCPQCQFASVPDSGFFMGNITSPVANETDCEVFPSSGSGCSIKMISERGAPRWGILPFLDPTCKQHMTDIGAPEYYCGFGEFAIKYISGPMFIAQFLFDAAELSMAGCSQTLNGFCTQTAAQRTFVEDLAKLKIELLENRTGFQPSCFGHVMTESTGLLNSLTVEMPTQGNGDLTVISLHEAVSQWLKDVSVTSTYNGKCTSFGCRTDCPSGLIN